MRVIILLFCLVSVCSFAQKQMNDSLKRQISVDSIKKILLVQNADTNKVNTLLALCKKVDNKLVLKYANEALILSEKINFDKGKIRCYYRIGFVYELENNYLQSEKYFSNILNVKLIPENKEFFAQVHTRISYACAYQTNYATALSHLKSALKLYKELGRKREMAESFQNLGGVYEYQNNYTDALIMLNQSLKIRNEIGDKIGLAQTYTTIGGVYTRKGDSNKGLQNIRKALEIMKSPNFKGLDWSLPYTYMSLGQIYETQGDSAKVRKNITLAYHKYEEASKNYLISLNLWNSTQNKGGLASLNLSLGNVSVKQNKLDLAKKYLDEGLKLSIKKNDIVNVSNGYAIQAELDSARGDYKNAYLHFKQYIVLRDSISNEEKTKKIVQSQMRYEFEQKESIAKIEQSKRDAQVQSAKKTQYFIIASLLIIVLSFLGIMYLQWRNSEQKNLVNNLLKQEKEKAENTLIQLKITQNQLVQSEKLASLGELTAGIAHEIQNPLNFVNNFSEMSVELIEELQEERSKETGERDESLEGELLGDIVQNLEKIAHHGKRASSIVKGMLEHSRTSTGKKELTDINALADEYLRLSYHGLRAKDKSFNADFKTELEENLPQIKVVPQDFGRVLLNLINNAFYAVGKREKEKKEVGGSFKPTVTLNTQSVDNQIIIKISDNGTGMPEAVKAKIFQPFFTTKPTGQGTGLGLSLSYDIVKAHGGELECESVENEGTTFLIKLPMS